MHYAEIQKKRDLMEWFVHHLKYKLLRQNVEKTSLTVTPGIRFAAKDAGDQVRITTPAKAKELGSDYIVVGRPITQAENPVEAYKICVKDFVG